MEQSAWKVDGAMPAADFSEMSEFTRLFGFNRSTAAMQDIVARPSCIVPLILSMLAAMAYMVVIRPQLTWTPNETFLAALGTGTAVLVRAILTAGVLTAYAALVSRESVKPRPVFAVVCYARMPGVLFTVLAIFLILLRRASGLPDGKPVNPMLTSLAVFLDPKTTSKFAYSVASSIDCVVFWELSLMALGLRAASRLSPAAATFGVVGLWAFCALAYAAWSQGTLG